MAAVLTGAALIRPNVVGDLGRERRAARALVGTLLLAGLALTAGVLARTITELKSPAWFAVIAGYAILGLAAALPSARRLRHGKWTFTLFLAVHTGMTVALLRSSPAHIDVEVYLREGLVALFHGHNPYAMTVPNIYPSPLKELFYGPGGVVNGRVQGGYPYLPFALLAAIPGFLLGDVRHSQLIAMVVTALVLRRLAWDPIGRAAAVLGVASVSAIPMLTGAWTEPASVALMACLVLALERRRHAFAALSLGLLLVSKQYFVVAIPIIWLIRQWLNRRMILIALGAAAAVTLPLFLVDPATFWKAIMGIQGAPLRPDSVSLLVSSVKEFGWPPPWTYGVLPVLGGGLTAITLTLRAPRTPPAFAASVGLTLLVTILLNKQAFMNYYFFVSGALLIAAVAWPEPTADATSEPASAPLDAQP